MTHKLALLARPAYFGVSGKELPRRAVRNRENPKEPLASKQAGMSTVQNGARLSNDAGHVIPASA